MLASLAIAALSRYNSRHSDADATAEVPSPGSLKMTFDQDNIQLLILGTLILGTLLAVLAYYYISWQIGFVSDFVGFLTDLFSPETRMEKPRRQKNRHVLKFLWHAAAFGPIVIVGIISFAFGVSFWECVLFITGAASTVSLELCLACILRKAERVFELDGERHILLGKLQHRMSRSIVARMASVDDEARNARGAVAKLGLISLASMLLFSTLIVLEVMRMKAAEEVLPAPAFEAAVVSYMDKAQKESESGDAPHVSNEAHAREIRERIQKSSEESRALMRRRPIFMASLFCGFLIIVMSLTKLWILTGEEPIRHPDISEDSDTEEHNHDGHPRIPFFLRRGPVSTAARPQNYS
jgi:hypothetical protein